MQSTPSETAAKPKKRGGFFGLFGSKDDAPGEPEPEVIELASANTGSDTPAASTDAAAPSAKQPAKDFEFQLSPIPRYKK